MSNNCSIYSIIEWWHWWIITMLGGNRAIFYTHTVYKQKSYCKGWIANYKFWKSYTRWRFNSNTQNTKYGSLGHWGVYTQCQGCWFVDYSNNWFCFSEIELVTNWWRRNIAFTKIIEILKIAYFARILNA